MDRKRGKRERGWTDSWHKGKMGLKFEPGKLGKSRDKAGGASGLQEGPGGRSDR